MKGTLISDMHTMSYWGLISPYYLSTDIILGSGVSYDINSINEYNNNKWDNMISNNKDTDFVIANGDLIDGINFGSVGAVANTDPYEQCRMSALYLSQFPRDIPIYCLKGTTWHSGREIVSERIIADILCDKYDMDARYAREGIVEECGIRIWSNHKSSHAKNKAAMLERKINDVAAAEKYCGGHIDVILRSHNHTFSCVYTKDHIAVMTPGWQHKTPYAIDNDLIMPPDIGYVNLIIEDGQIFVDRTGVETSPFGCPVIR